MLKDRETLLSCPLLTLFTTWEEREKHFTSGKTPSLRYHDEEGMSRLSIFPRDPDCENHNRSR